MKREATPFELKCLILIDKIIYEKRGEGPELAHDFLRKYNVQLHGTSHFEGNTMITKKTATYEL